MGVGSGPVGVGSGAAVGVGSGPVGVGSGAAVGVGSGPVGVGSGAAVGVGSGPVGIGAAVGVGSGPVGTGASIANPTGEAVTAPAWKTQLARIAVSMAALTTEATTTGRSSLAPRCECTPCLGTGSKAQFWSIDQALTV